MGEGLEGGGIRGPAVGTLLGPEGTGPRRVVGGVSSGPGFSWPQTARVPGGGCGVGWGGGGAAGWSLRTAQWTRASFDSVSEFLVGPPGFICFGSSSEGRGGGCGWGFLCGQVVKGTRWMPGHQEPMKDVGGCDKPRGAVNRALIRGFPNGGTPHQSCGVTRA